MKFYWIITHIRKLNRRVLSNIGAVISEAEVLEAFRGFTIRERIYHTWPMFQMLLFQVASRIACGEVIAWAIAKGLVPIDTCPLSSAYCNARNRFPEAGLRELMSRLGRAIEEQAHSRERVFGRDVKVVDGTSVQLPDSEANQEEYPQPDGQKPGCGQPLMRVCALMGLATGAIIDCAIGPYKTHERELFRRLWRSLNPLDIVLGDRGFGSYAEIAMLAKRGVDVVFRQKQKCLKNKKVEKIGRGEWLVTWIRPRAAGNWVNRTELPESMVLRAIRFRSGIKGFRSKEIILFTTLIDRSKYPAEKLKLLYYRRWEMELRFRDVKTTMRLELLTCKTPAGCRKEFQMGLIAYNLVRGVMLDASLRGKLPISRISFKGTLVRLDAFFNGILAEMDPQRAYWLLLDHLKKTRVPDRPGRLEPRKRKRRAKNKYSLLSIPRNAARIEALHA